MSTSKLLDANPHGVYLEMLVPRLNHSRSRSPILPRTALPKVDQDYNGPDPFELTTAAMRRAKFQPQF